MGSLSTPALLGSIAYSLVVSATAPAEAQGPVLSPDNCYAVSLEQPIDWSTSGAWADSHGLLLVDVLKQQVMELSPKGEVTRGVPEKMVSALGTSARPIERPSQIRTVTGGYLVEDEELDVIFRLNDHLEQVGSIAVKGRPMGEGRRLMAIYDWSPIGEGILAFGDLQGPGQTDWVSAFLYFDEAGHHEVFHTVARDDPARYHFVRNVTYIATAGDVGYVLLLGDEPRVAEVRLGVSGLRVLGEVPADLGPFPRFERQPHIPAPRQETRYLRLVEHSKMAAGLYAWDEGLYLLGKDMVRPDGGTAWWLVRIDPMDGAELSRARLPTNAAHLTVVPGDHWALIEKGPVQGIGKMHAPYMETSSMVLVPEAWMESLYGGLDSKLMRTCDSVAP